MKTNTILWIVLVVIIVLGLGWWWMSSQNAASTGSGEAVGGFNSSDGGGLKVPGAAEADSGNGADVTGGRVGQDAKVQQATVNTGAKDASNPGTGY